MEPEVYCYVGFVASFSESQEGDDPVGGDLAHFVAHVLERVGFANTEPAGMGYAWELFPTIDGVRIRTLIGFVGDRESTPPRQWLITNEVSTGLFARLLGRLGSTAAVSALRRLTSVLHSAMESDPRFSDIWWYNPETFDKPGDQPRMAPN